MSQPPLSNISPFPSRAPDQAPAGRVVFEGYTLDRQGGQLMRDGTPVPLAPQPFKLLDYFVSHPGRLISRDELQERVWGSETFVDFERGLNFCILQVRTALGDDARTPRFIETVPRRGYRFIAPVEPYGQPGSPNSSVEISPRSRWAPTAIALSVLVAVLAGGALLSRATDPVAGVPAKRRLAILPFDNLGPDADAYFADGLTEELINQVGRLDSARLTVIARTSVLSYRKTDKQIGAIARELDADYVMEGSVRRDGERLRISARLLDGQDQNQLWAESFDRSRSDALAVQGEIARRVTDSLQLRLAANPALNVINAAAHDEYLRGRFLWNQRRTAEVIESIARYRKALEHEPRFGLAWVGIAESHHLLQMRDRMTPLEARREIGKAVEQALRVEPSLPSAHAAAGTLAFWYDWNWREAEREFKQALVLSDSDVGAHHDYGWLLISNGRRKEGLSEIMRAQRLDPISPRATIDVAWAYIYMGQFDRAVAESRRLLERNPDFEEAYRCLEHAFLMKGDFAGALDAARNRMKALGRTEDLALIEGKVDPQTAIVELRKMNLRRFEEQSATGWVDPYSLAAEHAFLGDKNRAFELLGKAIELRSTNIPLMAADPMLRSLRGDPRFESLLERVGLKNPISKFKIKN